LEKESKFVEINNTGRIWAIGSIHSNLESFKSIRKYIYSKFENKDTLIFLGNILGLGSSAKETLTSAIELRSDLMAKHFIKPNNIIFLRGAQEEMMNKLLQLQTAPNPIEIVDWMFSHGVDKTIESYGFSKDEVKNIASSGTTNISKWTSNFNKILSSMPGHKDFLLSLKHAAYSKEKKILFVNRGVDITRPLSAQNDCFWWGFQNFSKLDKPYNTFVRIVRGYESQQTTNILNSRSEVVCTLFKQPLNYNKILAGIFDSSGNIIDLFESN